MQCHVVVCCDALCCWLCHMMLCLCCYAVLFCVLNANNVVCEVLMPAVPRVVPACDACFCAGALLFGRHALHGWVCTPGQRPNCMCVLHYVGYMGGLLVVCLPSSLMLSCSAASKRAAVCYTLVCVPDTKHVVWRFLVGVV